MVAAANTTENEPFIHVQEKPEGLRVAVGSAVSLLATIPGLCFVPMCSAVAWRSGHCTADG